MPGQIPVIKKIRKRQHAGHHGGSWKVAYADFVTAMMAFFLLMWLINAVPEEEKEQLSEFFEDPVIFLEAKQAGGASLIDLGGNGNSNQTASTEIRIADSTSGPEHDEETEYMDPEELLKKIEYEELSALKDSILQAVEENIALNNFKDQIKLDITREGLRIQLVDQDSRPMFNLGSSKLKDYAVNVLAELSILLQEDTEHRISISGHTDATPFSGINNNLSNWELSAERANSARRTIVEYGMSEGKVGRVIGLASSVLYDKENPYSPVNRRISIVVLNRQTAESIGLPLLESTLP